MFFHHFQPQRCRPVAFQWITSMIGSQIIQINEIAIASIAFCRVIQP